MFSRGIRISVGSAAALALSSIGWVPTHAADTQCGSRTCEEAICASNDVLICSDWNDLSYDGFAVSNTADRQGGNSGDVRPSVGLNGTAGWAHRIQVGKADTVWFDRGIAPTTGPIYARHYIKFSSNYEHRMMCGLQKMFYFETSKDPYSRIMLGVTAARDMGGEYASLPWSVGVFGFDYTGHIVRLPNQPGDKPVLIYPNRWYSVEIMVQYASASQNTVKIWVDGQLQMERKNFNDSSWTNKPFTLVSDTPWFGGDPSTCHRTTQEQWVYKDNHVISRSYIGPVGATTPAPPNDPPPSGAGETLDVSVSGSTITSTVKDGTGPYQFLFDCGNDGNWDGVYDTSSTQAQHSCAGDSNARAWAWDKGTDFVMEETVSLSTSTLGAPGRPQIVEP